MRYRLSFLFILFLVINTFYGNAQNAVAPYYDAESELFGFKDTVNNKIIVVAKYNDVNDFSEGMAAVNVGGTWDFEDEFSIDKTLYGGKWGFIDRGGKEIIPAKYDYVSNFSNGKALVTIDQKFGCINKLGVEFIPVKFDQIIDERSGYEVWYGDMRGYYDKSGKEILPAIYLYANLSGNGLTALVQSKDSTYGLIDIKTKKNIIESKLEMAETMNKQDHFIATKNGQYAVYDFSGKPVIPFAKYTLIDNVDDSLIAVSNGNSMAVCDVFEKFSVPFNIYNKISGATHIFDDFSELTYLKVSKEGKWGCATSKGQILIPLEYDREFDYADTTSAFKANNWVCIDKNNKTILSLNTNIYKNCELYYDWDLEKNLVSFTVNGNEYVMNMQSKIVGDKDKYWEDVSKAGGMAPKKPK
jgi:hypothetical protein